MTQTTPAAGPGDMLRQARTNQGLSLEQAARQLNLSSRHIAALEADDYQSLPGTTYVRGYLRRYANLLGLSPENVLDSFNRLPIAAHQIDLVAPAPVRQISSGDSLIKLGTLLVIGLVVGLAVVWWQGQERVGPPREPAVPPVALAPAQPTVDVVVPAPDAPAPVSRPADVPTARSPAEAPAPAARAPGANATPAPESSTPEVVNVDPNAPRARLVLYVMEESWADVRDAYQRRLIYETVPAGRVVTLEGPVPLNVFLGNVDGVRVELNGREYDTRRHKRGQIARFTVSESAPHP